MHATVQPQGGKQPRHFVEAAQNFVICKEKIWILEDVTSKTIIPFYLSRGEFQGRQAAYARSVLAQQNIRLFCL